MIINRKIRTKLNRINLIAALFLCSMFSFSAVAQNNPLDAGQLANLIKGLKGALQENLQIVEGKGGAQYTAVTKKWDARRDLGGKTKRQVIDLLYQDVKSVVTNSGMQYQIYQVFSFYNQIPDSQFSAKTDVPAKTSFTDPRDGQVYGIKKLGNLTWMKENLRYDMPDDSWCFADDDEACAELGMLYTFDGALKACPAGWRLPSDKDWLDLEKALGMSQNELMVDGYSATRGYREGLILQVGGDSGLDFKISGFATFSEGEAKFDGIEGDRPRSYFWTSTAKNINGQRHVYRRRIEANNGMVYRFSNPTEGYAVSVRCVQ